MQRPLQPVGGDRGGRFWALQDDDCGDEDNSGEISPVSSTQSIQYLCRSPSPRSSARADENLLTSSRGIKRMEKIRAQRYAALTLNFSLSDLSSEKSLGFFSTVAMVPNPLKRLSGRVPFGRAISPEMKLPLIPPSVFTCDNEPGEWILVASKRDRQRSLSSPRKIRLREIAQSHFFKS